MSYTKTTKADRLTVRGLIVALVEQLAEVGDIPVVVCGEQVEWIHAVAPDYWDRIGGEEIHAVQLGLYVEGVPAP